MDVPDELLRPGVELAWGVAYAGTMLRPAIQPPGALRPLMNFKKFPTKALATVRRVVEENEEFRRMVASVTVHEDVPRASWLWLNRPEGWEAELADLAAEAAQAAHAARDDAAGRAVPERFAKRLDAAESRVRLLATEVEVLGRGTAKAQEARDQAVSDAARAQQRAQELEPAAIRARKRADHAVAELDAQRAAGEAAAGEAASLRLELTALQDRLIELEARGVAAEVPAPAELVSPEPVRDEPSPASVLPATALEALGGAASAAAGLAESLRALTVALSPPAVEEDPPAAPAPAAVAARRPAVTNGAHRPLRRRALRLPRGMRTDTVEADAWLLTEAAAPVVVDGYNVAKLGWPDQVLADQRERLLDVLEDLAARHSTPVQVVFDGADVGPVRSRRRRRVAVRFSPPDVLADDVIRDVVAAHPVDEPIVVVTNDRAVIHDVRAAGANVVRSQGLLAVARR